MMSRFDSTLSAWTNIMDEEKKALRDAQLANAIEVSLARLRILISHLTTMRTFSDPREAFSRDLLALCAFATDIHQWLAEQYLEANSATPGESRHLMQKILEAVGATPSTSGGNEMTDVSGHPSADDPTVH